MSVAGHIDPCLGSSSPCFACFALRFGSALASWSDAEPRGIGYGSPRVLRGLSKGEDRDVAAVGHACVVNHEQ